jgi:hypothetical protein
MFFRREKTSEPRFDDRLNTLRQLGYTVSDQAGKTLVTSKTGCAAIVEQADGRVNIVKTGVVIGKEIGVLINGGYQMFFRTGSGKVVAAVAEKLKALHAFDEDLREALGLMSYYNESLGTTSEAHLYDRVANRDHGVPVRAWERK